MADKRIPVTYVYDPKTKELHRKKGGEGEEMIEDKIVALYEPAEGKETVTFPDLNHVRNFKQEVITFLAENELKVRHFVRADLAPDKPATKLTPPRPKKTKHEGDKTPAIVEYYLKHFPNEFETRYGVIGRYTGPVTILSPVWEDRPVVGGKTDGIKEYRGVEKLTYEVEDAMVATRTVCGRDGKRLTYLPDECIALEDEESAQAANLAKAVGEEDDDK